MPAERTTRGTSATGSIRNCRSRRDSCASNGSIPDTPGLRPNSPFRPTTPYGFSPYGTLTPGDSRPGSPLKSPTTRNYRKSHSSNQSFTSILAPASPPLSAGAPGSNSMETDPSTVTLECATALVENQKVQSFYEKPVYSETGEILSHGKVITKTVTMTITTTIASTEIFHPGEDGYQASMERYNKQREDHQQKQQQPQSPPNETTKHEVTTDKSFPEAFSPENTTTEERRDFFVNQNARFQEHLRRANYHSPSPSPPMSPRPNPTRQE